jgi:hypothetical protein
MEKESYIEEIQLRILRVTEDLRTIQRELNYAAMEAPGNPELMEALSQVPQIESLQVLRSALDQMRHFLWFYAQVMTTESDVGEKLREAIRQKPSNDAVHSESLLGDRLRSATETLLMHHLALGKKRKPN